MPASQATESGARGPRAWARGRASFAPYSTSVGLLGWAAREAQEAERRPAAKKSRKFYQQGQPIELGGGRGLEWFKRLLP